MGVTGWIGAVPGLAVGVCVAGAGVDVCVGVPVCVDVAGAVLVGAVVAGVAAALVGVADPGASLRLDAPSVPAPVAPVLTPGPPTLVASAIELLVPALEAVSAVSDDRNAEASG